MPDEPVRPRALWSGTLSFGLVNIPVDLFPAVRPDGVSLRMLAPDGTPLSRRFFCPDEDREVPWDDIVRGYEVDGSWVVVTDEELESVEPKRTRDIDLRQFVDRAELDPVFFERAYVLAPSGDSTKAYRLLAETMEKSSRAGIATLVMRTKEYLVAIVADDGLMRAETMRFPAEIRTPADLDLSDAIDAKAADVKTLRRFIREHSEKALAKTELEDRRAERLERIAKKKARAGDVVMSSEPEEDVEAADVIDLMNILKARLEGRHVPETKTDDDLEELTKDELYERAKERDVRGRSGMSKRQLIAALRRSA